MKPVKCCNNCKRGTPINLTRNVLCRYRGIVTPDYVCFKYKSVTDSSEGKQTEYKCVHCDYFMVELDKPNQNIGMCKLFSAREFDGTTRTSCSKFSKKLLIEVS